MKPGTLLAPPPSLILSPPPPRAPLPPAPTPQGTLPLPALAARLAAAGAGGTALLSAPIAAASFDPASQPLPFALAAGVGTFGLTTALAGRIAGGWSYVGGRLLSAAIPYEETGWYDGQTFVKPPPVLARDRLLGTYEVRKRGGGGGGDEAHSSSARPAAERARRLFSHCLSPPPPPSRSAPPWPA